MALDPYSSCPCGSGKKFKWCCQPIHVTIDRAFQQDAEGQHESALRLMDEVVAEHSGNPEAWGRKAQLLYQNQRLEDAESALQKAFEINPDYPAGHFMRGLFRYNEGEIHGALLLFRKAADLYDPQAHDTLAEVYSLIANCELRLNRPVAAGAALRKALHSQRANPELQKAFDDLYGSKSRLPETARKEYTFLTLPTGENRRATWDRALAGSLTGRFPDAVRAFETLTREEANDPAAWYNLAISNAWVGNHPDALEALERYVTLESDESKAAAAWALGEVLRCGDGMQDRADYAEYSAVYQVRDPRPLIAALQEWQKTNRLVVIQADEQGTSLTALLLEAPSGLITSEASSQPLRLSSYLMLAGNYLRLACVNKEWLAGAQREVQQKLGPALADPHERVGPPLFSDVVTSALIFPIGVEDEARAQQLVTEHAQKYFEEAWIHQPLHALNGTPPIDAVGHATLRKKLRGVVQFLQECAATGAIHTYDFDRLRRKLGLLESKPDAPSSAGGVGDIATMGAADLAALPIETLPDAQVELAYQTAQKLDAHELGVRFAQALIARPPSAEKTDRFPWYAYLLQRALAEGRNDAALDLVDAGEKADCEQNEGKRRNDYEFRRGQIHAKRGEADQAHDVFQRLINRAPPNPRYNGSAAEAMLTLKQPAEALRFAEDGLTKARQLNDRDSEGYLMELVAAAKKQGA
jgi:tetratricopeptide (TPR) repeat protein